MVVLLECSSIFTEELWRWIKESPAARATSLMYTEKRVGPRIRDVVGEPGEAII